MSISHVQVRKNKARHYLQKGNFQKAREALLRVCKTDRNDIEAHFLLSAVYGNLGQYDRVLKTCQAILKLQPGFAPAYVNMANALTALGRHEEAAASFDRALHIDPNNPVTLNNYGHALFLSGQAERALAPLEKALALRPDYAEAHSNLGQALYATGELARAILAHRESVRLNPGLFEGYIRLADELSEIGSLEDAEKTYCRALELREDAVHAWRNLATVYRYQSRLEDAMAAFEKVCRRWPNDVIGPAGVIDTLERMGRGEEAYAHIRRQIAANQVNATIVNVYSRLCHKYGDCEEAITLCERVIDSTTTIAGEKQGVHYALGHLLDRLGRYDAAFSQMRAANDMSNLPYNKLTESNYTDAMIMAFSRGSLAGMPRASLYSSRPVFIVGMPRSGTTLVEQILAAHPDVHGAGELPDVTFLAAEVRKLLLHDGGYPVGLVAANQQIFNQMAARYLECIGALAPHAVRITDKMPHNFRHLGLIQLLFPGAHVIHCRRNPLDTCLSIYSQSFNRMHNYAVRLDSLGHFYREYERLMVHWHDVLDLPILDVCYEELIENPQEISRSLVEFCGLEWDDRCLNFHQSGREVATASYNQVRQPIYKQSRERWRNYEAYLGPLYQALDMAASHEQGVTDPGEITSQ